MTATMPFGRVTDSIYWQMLSTRRSNPKFIIFKNHYELRGQLTSELISTEVDFLELWRLLV